VWDCREKVLHTVYRVNICKILFHLTFIKTGNLIEKKGLVLKRDLLPRITIGRAALFHQD